MDSGLFTFLLRKHCINNYPFILKITSGHIIHKFSCEVRVFLSDRKEILDIFLKYVYY